MPAVLFGSISTLADTSELQRSAYNAAFAEHGLDWRWDRDDYRGMLTGNGGQDRVAAYARSRGESVDARAVHDTKSKIFQERLGSETVPARPGVVDTVRAAKDRGWRVGLVTTTSRANIAALLDGVADLHESDFDVIVDAGGVDRPKPDPAAYLVALDRLAERPDACAAIEDNTGGVAAATGAGVPCVAFPNANTAGHDFGGTPVVERLAFDDLAALVGTG